MLENKSYVPTLAVRASEMNGLEFLPGLAKDRIMPCFLLAPWASSNSIERTIDRIERAFPNRHYFLDIDAGYSLSNTESLPQQQIAALKNSADSYKNWTDFIKDHKNIIPCLQLGSASEKEFLQQIQTIQEMGRNFCVRICKDYFPRNIRDLTNALISTGSADFAVILEGGYTNDALTLSTWFLGEMSSNLKSIDATVPTIISCTSIPNLFIDYNGNKPFEVTFSNRELINQISKGTNRQRIIYGDWGSTRPRYERNGGQRPIARIDYPTDRAWLIARNKEEHWDFRKASIAILGSPQWNGKLGIWGEEMIQSTSVNQALGIDTPQKNIACRVNIHIYKQAFFGLPPLGPDALDEEWED